MADIFDVAAAIDERLDRDAGAGKLCALLYLAQDWSLAWTGRELFADEAEAWERGLVFPIVRNDIKYDGETRLRAGDPARLSESERLMTEAVVDHYGHLSGADLSAITHS
ncbi:SocA family protein [Nanchangia anserum]|uniref:SocA family protein n=1 Tax=Nanchangia anserum TaxID=2692125 RepID=A0A8I0GCW2_9ACTO|nr:Panacea domain-containing protein [Nanchangia anserum]MBD3689830.1 SocA family protein [Nanchangia anserum]QOX82000.1 SocA family protein [Nanchangia anserum]